MTVRTLRLSRGLSLRQVAKDAEISPTFLTLVESGKSNPSPETASRILNAINATPGESVELVAGWTAPLHQELARWQEILNR